MGIVYHDLKIEWLGHDTFKIEAGIGHKTITFYIDPFNLGDGLPAADYVLVTHDHFDHCQPESLVKIVTPTTTIIAPEEVEKKIDFAVDVLLPNQTKTYEGFSVQAVHAYNLNKFRDKETETVYHPRLDGKVGFILDIGGKRIYHAGDTDYIPEMDYIECDIALLPVSGKYVMTAEEAAEAVRIIKPRIAIPMHYGSIVGSDADAQEFKDLLSGTGIKVHFSMVQDEF